MLIDMYNNSRNCTSIRTESVSFCTISLSPPIRGRGLKFVYFWLVIWFMKMVAPYTGAWIEIPREKAEKEKRVTSPPIRGRGLKSYIVFEGEMSRAVAPYTGAWIEISNDWAQRQGGESRPLYGGVDWNIVSRNLCDLVLDKSPPIRGRGLKLFHPANGLRWYSRPLYGGVDWNWLSDVEWYDLDSSPPIRGRGLK